MNRFVIAVVSGWASALIGCAESAIKAPAPEAGYDAPPFEFDASGVFSEGSPSGSDAVRASDAVRGGARDASSAPRDAGLALDATLAAEAGLQVQDAAPSANPVSSPGTAAIADSGAAISDVPAVAEAGAPACAPELRQCGTECVDVRSSGAHCGECGRVCAAGESCSDSRCVAPGLLRRRRLPHRRRAAARRASKAVTTFSAVKC